MDKFATWYGGMEQWWKWELVSLDGVAPSRMVSVSASVNLPLHHKVQKFSSGTGSPELSLKKGCKTVVVVVWLERRLAPAQATLCSMGTQVPLPKRGTAAPPLFGRCLLWPNG